MMYQKGLALSIKQDNEFLREKNSFGRREVFLYFGSEYSIYLKNKNDLRVKFQVKIDGKYTHPKDTWFVVSPHSSFELERFMLDGDMSNGERFKFVDVKGSGEEEGLADNGVIEVIVKKEKKKRHIKPITNHFLHRLNSDVKTGGISLSKSGRASVFMDALYSSSCMDEQSDEGVTVGGSNSYQSFISTDDFETGKTIEFKIKLKPIKTKIQTDYSVCPGCNGTKIQTDYDGIKHVCPVCNGTGKFYTTA